MIVFSLITGVWRVEKVVRPVTVTQQDPGLVNVTVERANVLVSLVSLESIATAVKWGTTDFPSMGAKVRKTT